MDESGGAAPGVAPLLGRYRVGPEIGRGGMSTVYRGEDTRLGRAVAIKVLAPHLSSDPVFRGRLLAEARAAAGLPHPHIVRVLDVDTVEGAVVLVLELVEGESLKERLERGALGVGEAVEIGAQVAEALAFAHSKGIVHRDVKPHNVLLGQASPEAVGLAGAQGAESSMGMVGRPRVWAKLADFGIARAVDGTSTMTAAGVVLGSAPYLAPELLEGEVATPASDVYALGVTLYQMLVGRLPFEGGTTAAALSRRLTADAVRVGSLRPEVPAWLDELVARALARRPEERVGSADELARWLRDPHGATTRVVARPVRTDAAVGRRVPRGRRLGGALAGLFAAVAVAVVVMAVIAAAPRGTVVAPTATAAATAQVVAPSPVSSPVPTAPPPPPTPTAVVIRAR